MSYSNIKRVLSVALLLVFAAPSATTLSACAYSTSDVSQYKASMLLTGDVCLTEKNEQITLSLRDSDVKQVLRMFADKVGLNIVFHDSVSGKVTLDLVKTPINEAFSLVLQITGLSYYKQGNTMIILAKNSPDNAAFSKQQMYTFPIEYVNAVNIANFLNKNVFGMKKAGLSAVNAATVNAATNELIVFGMPSDIAIVQKVIEQFDREPLSRTFTVNHTTPAQMADMICNVLIPSRGTGGGSSDDGGGSDDSSSYGDETGAAAGIITGAAAAAGDEGGEGGGGSAMKLGEGIVACTSSVTNSNKEVSPFELKGLTIAYFPQRGTITMMGGSEAQANMIANFIKTHDVKQPQAFLELSIVELTEDGSKSFQNQWQISTKAWQFGFDGQSTSGGRLGGFGGNWVPATQYQWSDAHWDENGKWNPGGVGSYDSESKTWTPPTWMEIPYKVLAPNTTYIQWVMNYLIQNQKGRVLASPKILITNGQESLIDLTQDYVEKVDTEFIQSASNGTSTVGTVQREYTIAEDLGIKVTLTPFISPEGYVTLNIVPDYSTIQSRIYDSDGMPAVTLLSRRNLDLKNVRIKDGETLVLGGMIQETEQKTVAKIPLLGDLPIIGAAFRSTSNSKAKSELVIMITPHIINDGDGTVVNNSL